MKKRIYFVRHGETDCNKRNEIQGSGINAPLNELGKRQALAFYNYYHSIPFDKTYTSSLIRTHQSMEHFINSGVPHETVAGFNEMSFGDMEGKSMFDEKGNFMLADLLKKWKANDIHAKVNNGESPYEVMEREKKALEHVLSRPEEKNIVVCMHGRALRILLCYLLDQPICMMENHLHNNLEASIFDYDYESKKYYPVEIMSSRHLETIK